MLIFLSYPSFGAYRFKWPMNGLFTSRFMLNIDKLNKTETYNLCVQLMLCGCVFANESSITR